MHDDEMGLARAGSLIGADYDPITAEIERQRYGFERFATRPRGNRVMGKGEEARLALAHVLGSVETGVSVAALERAISTLKAHLGDAP